MIDNFYLLPLWLQIFYYQEDNIYIRGLLRQTNSSFNKKLFIKDFNDCYKIYQNSWYNINENYDLIGNNSIRGLILYTCNFNKYESCIKFIN